MLYVEDGNTPAYKHQTQESAEKEAKRLAKLTGKKVFILQAQKCIELNEFKETYLREFDDDNPF